MNPTQQNQPSPPAAPPGDPTVLPAGLPRAEEQRVAPPLAPDGPGRAPTLTPFQGNLPGQPAAPAGSTAPVQPAATASAEPGQPAKEQPKPKSDSHPNSTQNTLQIAEIRDGIVIMNDGSYRAVVMVKSINFDLMSPQEQEAVEYSYQGFLNSLYFQVQIFIRSQMVDLRPYIEKLDKIRTEHDNMLLALLMEDYIGYIDQLSQQTNIMDKSFYVVIPFFPVTDLQKGIDQSKNFFKGLGGVFRPKEQHVTINEKDLEDAKTELRNRVQAVLAGLQQSGIQGLPLDTQELIELYYDTYNPDTATRQHLENIDGLTADIITRGEGSAPQAHLQGELN